MANLYPDPLLAGSYATYDVPSVVAETGQFLLRAQGVHTIGDTESDMLNTFGTNTVYNISVYVFDYQQGGASASLLGGDQVDLGISASGWTAPVAMLSGSAEGPAFRIQHDDNANFRIAVDGNTSEAIRIEDA